MQRGEKLYSGKAKSVYKCDRDDALILHFRNDTSAFDGEIIEQLDRKGIVNNKFNAFIMEHLEKEGIKTHFLELLADDEVLVRNLDMFPIECVVRNIASGSICKRLGTEDGLELNPPTFEFFLKNDALHDPMINEHHIVSFGWATEEAIAIMKEQTFKVNPDGCRIWDAETREKLDKDRFRKGLGGVIEAYEQVAQRLGLEL